ncbi:hypothetical protein Desor_1426 [Desulfosporosinus orientis DSM 765]|uniref:Uncharacterized protein n=1 Tax=Desulfosporosinus orientis (strain ATCC 19365 / DSM 765 / NCIMB 8382 / VKM B-1628 / Singapore I) TaxID=768706 RepID=G7W8E3_DESOD|nr:hypothetical protein [Desulfosporosinus orientis]AET67083.1 hypothetical protein Desor_1426 [Desulfosporosinus orientis DSM 765]
MIKEQEILDFLEAKLFNPILQSPSTTERFKSATRGLRLRMKQRDAQGMIQYFWNTVVDTNAKHANYGRMLQNEGFPEFEELLNDFRVRFKDL